MLFRPGTLEICFLRRFSLTVFCPYGGLDMLVYVTVGIPLMRICIRNSAVQVHKVGRSRPVACRRFVRFDPFCFTWSLADLTSDHFRYVLLLRV